MKPQDDVKPNEGQSASTGGLERALPCPFCGGVDISDGEILAQRIPYGPIVTQSQCLTCGALGAEAQLGEGEVDYGSVKAIAAWNKRSNK